MTDRYMSSVRQELRYKHVRSTKALLLLVYVWAFRTVGADLLFLLPTLPYVLEVMERFDVKSLMHFFSNSYEIDVEPKPNNLENLATFSLIVGLLFMLMVHYQSVLQKFEDALNENKAISLEVAMEELNDLNRITVPGLEFPQLSSLYFEVPAFGDPEEASFLPDGEAGSGSSQAGQSLYNWTSQGEGRIGWRFQTLEELANPTILADLEVYNYPEGLMYLGGYFVNNTVSLTADLSESAETYGIDGRVAVSTGSMGGYINALGEQLKTDLDFEPEGFNVSLTYQFEVIEGNVLPVDIPVSYFDQGQQLYYLLTAIKLQDSEGNGGYDAMLTLHDNGAIKIERVVRQDSSKALEEETVISMQVFYSAEHVASGLDLERDDLEDMVLPESTYAVFEDYLNETGISEEIRSGAITSLPGLAYRSASQQEYSMMLARDPNLLALPMLDYWSTTMRVGGNCLVGNRNFALLTAYAYDVGLLNQMPQASAYATVDVVFPGSQGITTSSGHAINMALEQDGSHTFIDATPRELDYSSTDSYTKAYLEGAGATIGSPVYFLDLNLESTLKEQVIVALLTMFLAVTGGVTLYAVYFLANLNDRQKLFLNSYLALKMYSGDKHLDLIKRIETGEVSAEEFRNIAILEETDYMQIYLSNIPLHFRPLAALKLINVLRNRPLVL